MACPLCGDRCTCSAIGDDLAGEHTAVLIDPDPSYSTDLTEQQFASSLESTAPGGLMRPSSARIAVAQTATATADPAFYRPNADLDTAWRDEIAQRVQAHKARRRRRFDPEASMSFGFDPVAEAVPAVEGNTSLVETPPERLPRMYRRIALQVEAESVAKAAEATPVPETNIIEFPRPVTEEMFPEELAEPILDTPRILDVPEEAPPAPTAAALPSFATIQLDEDNEVPDWIRDYREDYEEAELELPLQVAPVRSRLLASLIDVALVLTATALFSVIVLSITKFLPQGKTAALTGVILSAVFWLAYHYAFLVFSGSTPGMQVAQLELCSFEGCYPLRRMRGQRAWAMGISCMSVGMGFAWAMVDEDNLGWHDRITRTYLRQS